MNHFDIAWRLKKNQNAPRPSEHPPVRVIACKLWHNLSSCNPPTAKKTFWVTFDNFGVIGWGAHQTDRQTALFSVACSSRSGMLTALNPDTE